MWSAGWLFPINHFVALKRLIAVTLTIVLSACGSQVSPTASPTVENNTSISVSASPTSTAVSTATSPPSATKTVIPVPTATDLVAEGSLFIPGTGPTSLPTENESPNAVDPATNPLPETDTEPDKFQNFQPTNAFLIPVTGYPPGIATRPRPDLELVYDIEDLWLAIPVLGINIPIVGVGPGDGTWDVSWLWEQAGWLQGTAFPTWKGNSVITAHVVTADGKNGPFVHLKALGNGEFVFINASGYRYVYQVISKDSVKPDDASVFSHEVDSRLTLITCESYDEATGTYLLRTVVRAKLVDIQQ